MHVIQDALREIPRHLIADHKAITQAWPRARSFVFSDAASTWVGGFIRDCEDLILTHQQFAIPPYPTTYLEFNCRLAYEALGRPQSTARGSPFEDDRVGYLLDAGRWWTFSRQRDGKSGIGPLVYTDGPDVQQWWPLRDRRGPDIEPHVWAKLACFLGSSIHAMPSEAVRQALHARFGIGAAIANGAIYKQTDTYTHSMGDGRNILALLLLLNQPKAFTLSPNQPRPLIQRGKRVVFTAHHTVEIRLGAKPAPMRRLFHAYSDRHMPWHEVMGHFVHRHIAPGCTHAWPIEPEERAEGEPTRWRCRLCGGLRTWRTYPSGHGSPREGVVTKDYAVKAPDENEREDGPPVA
jgi:hypothetical protein